MVEEEPLKARLVQSSFRDPRGERNPLQDVRSFAVAVNADEFSVTRFRAHRQLTGLSASSYGRPQRTAIHAPDLLPFPVTPCLLGREVTA